MRDDDLQSHNSNNWLYGCNNFLNSSANPIAPWTSCHRQNLTLYTTNKEAKFLFSPLSHSLLFISPLCICLYLCLVLSSLLSCLHLLFSSLLCAMQCLGLCIRPRFLIKPLGLTSSRVCIYEAPTILSTLETDLWYWVIVGCGAEEENRGLCPNCGRN